MESRGKIMRNKKLPDIRYWLTSSRKDFCVAQSLFNLKHYPQCLFFCHLSLEKLLKAVMIKITKEYPPYIHDLRRLAELAKVHLTEKQKQILDMISTFNIAGRYSDEKLQFYKRYNKRNFAQRYLRTTEELISWLRKEFLKK